MREQLGNSLWQNYAGQKQRLHLISSHDEKDHQAQAQANAGGDSGGDWFRLAVNEDGDTDEPWGLSTRMPCSLTNLRPVRLVIHVAASAQTHHVDCDANFEQLTWNDGDIWKRVHEPSSICSLDLSVADQQPPGTPHRPELAAQRPAIATAAALVAGRAAVAQVRRHEQQRRESYTVVREWSQLYQLTGKHDTAHIEALGRKTQLLHAQGLLQQQEVEGQPRQLQMAGLRSRVQRAIPATVQELGRFLFRVADAAICLFLAYQSIMALIECHRQWFAGEPISLLQGPNNHTLDGPLGQLLRVAVFCTVTRGLRSVIAPTVVFTILGFVMSLLLRLGLGRQKVRNWLWAEELVTKVREAAANCTLEVPQVHQTLFGECTVQTKQALATMVQEAVSSPAAVRSVGQTELLLMVGTLIAVCSAMLLQGLNGLLRRQLRHVRAQRNWKKLRQVHFDSQFEGAFKQFDSNQDGEIDASELYEAIKTLRLDSSSELPSSPLSQRGRDQNLGSSSPNNSSSPNGGSSSRRQLSRQQQREVSRLMQKADLDANGSICVSEFKKIMYADMEASANLALADPRSSDHHPALLDAFQNVFDRTRNGYITMFELQYVLDSCREKLFGSGDDCGGDEQQQSQSLQDIASAMMEAAGARPATTADGRGISSSSGDGDTGELAVLTYADFARAMTMSMPSHTTTATTTHSHSHSSRVSSWLQTVWRSINASVSVWFLRDAVEFTEWLLAWRYQALESIPTLYLPTPLLLPLAFAPGLAAVTRMAALCTQLVEEQANFLALHESTLLLSPSPSSSSSTTTTTTGLEQLEECEFQFFGFQWAWPWAVQQLLTILLGVTQPLPTVLAFPGLPLTKTMDWLLQDALNTVHELGFFTTLPPLALAVWEWQAHRQEETLARKKQNLASQKVARRVMMEQVQFSLCMLHENRLTAVPDFKQATLFEVKLKELVKEQQSIAAAVKEAAEMTTAEYPFIHCLEAEQWKVVRGMILNELSARFSKGYLAEELGVETTKKKFWFGFANEKGLAETTTTKLRVIVASDVLLRQVYEMNHRRPEPVQPAFNKSYHAKRWKTVSNMAALLADRAHWEHAPLREMELCLPMADTAQGGGLFEPTNSLPLQKTCSNYSDYSDGSGAGSVYSPPVSPSVRGAAARAASLAAERGPSRGGAVLRQTRTSPAVVKFSSGGGGGGVDW